MPYNPKSLLNLRRPKKGESANPAGRPKTLAGAIKSIPRDAQVRVHEVLHHALALPNVKAAERYLKSEEVQAALPDYGFLLQIAVRSLMSKQGWLTAMDILDRLFGKPKQTTQTNVLGRIDVGDKPVIMFAAEAPPAQPAQAGEEGAK